MRKQFDEEMLAAYALDELNAPQAAAVEELLVNDPQARATVDEYRQLAALAKKAVKAAPQLQLDELRRKRILQQAKVPRKSAVIKRAAALAAAAALVIIGAAVLIPAASQRKPVAGSITAVPQSGDAVRTQLESLGYLDEAKPAPATGATPKAGDASFGTALSSRQPDRYLVKTAVVAIETDDARKAADEFTAQAVALGGYVGNLNERTDGLGRHTVMLEVRVPADKLNGALDALDGFGKILTKQVSAQDVTEQYVDNESRIRNLAKTEERLLDHLGKTSMIENTLKIEAELNRVREQLELIQGRQRVLSHRVAFSSISATFTETPKAESVAPVNTFSAGRVATDAVRSLLEFSRALLAKLIWVGVWLPVWSPFLLVGWLIWRKFPRA